MFSNSVKKVLSKRRGDYKNPAGGLVMIFDNMTAFQLFILAFAVFDTFMLMLMLKALRHIKDFNRALHNVLLDKHLDEKKEEPKTHLFVKFQTPVRIWKEIEHPKPAVFVPVKKAPELAEKKTPKEENEEHWDRVLEEEPKKEASLGKKIKKTNEPEQTKPVECAVDMHKWVKDKEDKFYCSVCGKVF
jgi:hypothetical protein